MTEVINTYQTRLDLSSHAESQLNDYAFLFNKVERNLYADVARSGKLSTTFKNEYLRKFGITARQFNSVRVNLDGKIASVVELNKQYLKDKKAALAKNAKLIKSTKASIKRFKTKLTTRNIDASEISIINAALSKKKTALHVASRKSAKLTNKITELKESIAAGNAKLCFGSRTLFKKQHNLEINGYQNHQEWLQEWQSKRNGQFYIIGSKDETSGCQGCVATTNKDGSFNLKLRLPDAINDAENHKDKYVSLKNITFAYGADVIKQALLAKQAINYRFLRDNKGWRLFISTKLPEIKIKTIRLVGAIGVDINADKLAITEVNRHGNPVGYKILPMVTYGKATGQSEALIGELAKELVAYALRTCKPIIIEELDFSKKKAQLKDENPKQARLLSSFAYNSIITAIKSRAYRFGVEVIEVNPAYTSTIGAVNYAKRLGLSVHLGAALAIARRGMGCHELPVGQHVTVPAVNGDYVTFALPVRNAAKHVSSPWPEVHTILKVVHAAHWQLLKEAKTSESMPPLFGCCKTGKGTKDVLLPFTVKSRKANRPQYCSAGVGDDIPW